MHSADGGGAGAVQGYGQLYVWGWGVSAGRKRDSADGRCTGLDEDGWQAQLGALGFRMNLSCNSNEVGALDEGREGSGAASASTALWAGGAGFCRSGAGESDWRAYRLYGWVCNADGDRLPDGCSCERARGWTRGFL